MPELMTLIGSGLGLAVGAFTGGYFKRAGGIAAESTSVLKSETVHRKEKQGNLEVIEKLEELHEEQSEGHDEYEEQISEYERIINSLKEDSIAREKLIENYWKPLHALVICFTKIEKSTGDSSNFIKKEIEKECTLHQLSGSTYIILPKDVPERLKSNPASREEIEEWFNEEIYCNYPEGRSHIGFVGLVDLRNVYSRTDYTPDDLPHFFSTVDKELQLEELFNEADFSRMLANESVNLTEIIEEGDIAFFVSKNVTPDELEVIHDEQDVIEDELGNPNLKRLASEVPEGRISDVLSDYVSTPDEVAASAKEQAQIWKEQLYS